MKALITGGAGFIGSHLGESLLQKGHDVVAIDDLSTGSLDNIKSMEADEHFKFVYGNVRNTETMHLLIERCDVVFHLAAAVGVQLIVDKPVHTIETNIHGSEVVLEVANKFRKKVLIASSSEVYGKSEAVPFHEDDDTVLGSTRFSRWSYACSKAIDEFLAMAYFEQYSLPVVVVRFFNTVGPRQTGQYGMVIPRFVEWAVKGEPITIYGNGKQSRCFAYVGDIVEGIIDLMSCSDVWGRVYNIGSAEETTIEELADKIIELTASKSEKKFISYQEAYGKPFDDMVRRVPCLKRINETIGYEPKTNFEQTLRYVIDDVKKRLGM
jgi:UDP-glucose 4-epimerase